MCGQWSEEGRIRNRTVDAHQRMNLEEWKRLVDEAAHDNIRFTLVRGGKPLLK